MLEGFCYKWLQSKNSALTWKDKIDVDAICGGPPCQGISGFNRFRNKDNPLQDEKNKQLQRDILGEML